MRYAACIEVVSAVLMGKSGDFEFLDFSYIIDRHDNRDNFYYSFGSAGFCP